MTSSIGSILGMITVAPFSSTTWMLVRDPDIRAKIPATCVYRRMIDKKVERATFMLRGRRLLVKMAAGANSRRGWYFVAVI